MKKLVLLTENGKKHYANTLWKLNEDREIFEILNEIETKETLTFELLEKVYKRFNSIKGRDSTFELIRENENEVVISWKEDDWIVKFVLE